MHVHISALEAFTTFLYVICVGFVWRLLSSQLAKSSSEPVAAIGKAMATIY